MKQWPKIILIIAFLICYSCVKLDLGPEIKVVNTYVQKIIDIAWSEDQKEIYYIYSNGKVINSNHKRYAFKNAAIPNFFVYHLSLEKPRTNQLIYSHEPKPPQQEYIGSLDLQDLSFVKDLKGFNKDFFLSFRDFDKSVEKEIYSVILVDLESRKTFEKSVFNTLIRWSKPFCKINQQISTHDKIFDSKITPNNSELDFDIFNENYLIPVPQTCLNKQNLIAHKEFQPSKFFISQFNPTKRSFENTVPVPLPSANPAIIDPEWTVWGWIGDDNLAFRKKGVYKYFNYSKQELHDFQGPKDNFEVFAISPDYKKVAYVTEDKLFVADINGENKIELLDITQDLPKGDRVEIDTNAS